MPPEFLLCFGLYFDVKLDQSLVKCRHRTLGILHFIYLVLLFLNQTCQPIVYRCKLFVFCCAVASSLGIQFRFLIILSTNRLGSCFTYLHTNMCLETWKQIANTNYIYYLGLDCRPCTVQWVENNSEWTFLFFMVLNYPEIFKVNQLVPVNCSYWYSAKTNRRSCESENDTAKWIWDRSIFS